MMMQEDFIRCKCYSATFKKEEVVMLDKTNFQRRPAVYEPLQRKIQYRCTSCGDILGEEIVLY